MPRPRLAFTILIVAVLVAAVAAGVLGGRSKDDEQNKPELMLLTSLPLVFPERFSLDGGGSPALSALEKHYRVIPISLGDAESLKQGRLLLMAHPRAQTAEALVDLDDWVRAGGRVLLLADPQLDWPSERPLGDPLRPPPTFADTGLLKHWGLTLYSPVLNGRTERDVGGVTWRVQSPGELEREGSACRVSGEGLIARCTIGKGKATIVADADLLDADRMRNGADDNFDAIIGELQRLAPESS